MTKAPRIVAITGGIGSGKSAVARFFEEFGASVVDADLLAREVVQPGTGGLQAVTELFPKQVVTLEDGSLDRKKIGSIIFSDPDKKRALEAILHPRIRTRWLEKLEEFRRSGKRIVVYVVPLLFESSTPMPELDTVVLVTAPEELRVARVVSRDHLPPEAARQRIHAQLPDSQKIPRSDFIISNESTLEELRQRSQQVFNQIASSMM